MAPRVLILTLAATLLATRAEAASLFVFTGGSLLEPLKTVAADYTRATGNTVTFSAATTGVLLKRIHAGEKPDVVVISSEAMDGLLKEGRIAPGSALPIANSILGVAVRAGAPRPDISTPEKFKATMLSAKSIVYPDPALGATSGTYLRDLFKQMGIAEAMATKTIVKPVGAEAAAAVGTGEAEVVVTFISEMLTNPAIAVVGPLPRPILNPTPYSAGVSVTAADPATGRAFVEFMTRPDERAKLKAAGVDPAA